MLKIQDKDILNTMEKGPINRSLFSNGACYTFHHAKGFNGAKVTVSFLAGSMFEGQGEQGLAHLVEHLVFKEVTTKRVAELEANGAELNAYTYKETISFEMDCHKDNLGNLLPIFLDHFFTLDFNEEQFRNEKKVILHELKEDEDDHEAQGIEELFEKNFNFAIGHPVGGRAKDVKKFSTDDVRKYFLKYFRAERLIITIVSGKKNSKESLIHEKIEQYFSLNKKQPVRLKAGKRKENLVPISKIRIRKMESSVTYFSFEGPKVNDKNYYDYVIMDELFFEGLSSFFFKRLREDRPLVYGMGSSLNSFHQSGQYLMVFSGNGDKSKELKSAVIKGLDEFLAKPISEEQIKMIKKRLKQSWELSFDILDERLEFLLDQEIYGMHKKTLKEMRHELDQVDGKSVQKCLKKMYKDQKYSYLLYKNRGK